MIVKHWWCGRCIVTRKLYGGDRFPATKRARNLIKTAIKLKKTDHQKKWYVPQFLLCDYQHFMVHRFQHIHRHRIVCVGRYMQYACHMGMCVRFCNRENPLAMDCDKYFHGFFIASYRKLKWINDENNVVWLFNQEIIKSLWIRPQKKCMA